MEALGDLSPVDVAQAQVTNLLGDFLKAEQTLVKLQVSSSLSVASQAAALYKVHQDLQGQLSTQLSNLQQMSSGGFTMSSVTGALGAASFAKQLSDHIDAVKQLQQTAQAGPPGATGDASPDATTMFGYGAGIIGLGILIWAMMSVDVRRR